MGYCVSLKRKNALQLPEFFLFFCQLYLGLWNSKLVFLILKSL